MKILHIDIETAPNLTFTWGLWNQNISINQINEPGYTMCYAARWHNKGPVMFESIHSTKPERMIERAWGLLDEADAVVHYNGTKFDIPTLKREFVMLGLEPPSKFAEIDLLKVVRKQFRFTSNKLDYVAQELGLGAKTQHTGMQLWRDCMDGCPAAWRLMERYNKQDVVLLRKLYLRLLPWITNHPSWGVYLDRDRPTCRNCGSTKVIKKGEQQTTTQVYQRYKCSSCGTPLRGRTRLRKAAEGVLV